MTNDQIKQDRSLEKIAMNIVYQIGDVLEASVDKRQATNDKAIEFVQGLLVDLERVIKQEARLTEKIKCLEAINRQLLETKDIAEFDRWQKVYQLIRDND